MRKLTKLIQAQVLEFSELTKLEQNLLLLAAQVRLNAQAPYSHYWVGAAILSAKGTINLGCNVERCSWTQTTHAEENAIDSMIAEDGSTKISVVAIVAGPEGSRVAFPPKKIENPISRIEEVPVPCGQCLQVIWENCRQDPTVKLLSLAANGEILRTTIGDAFPMRFGPEDLGVKYE